MTARAVRSLGHEVVSQAVDRSELLAALGRGNADVAIVDGRLPGSDVGELVRAARECAPRTAIVVIASPNEPDLLRAAIDAGARGGLGRPIRIEALANAFAHVQGADLL